MDIYGLSIFGQFSQSNSNISYNTGNRKLTTKCTLGSDSAIDGLCFLTTENDAVANVRGIVYADDAGNPGELLGVTDELVGVVYGENYLFFSSPLNLTAGSYWIGFITDKAFYFKCTFATNSLAYNNDTYSDGPSDPFGSPSKTWYGPYVYAFTSGTDTVVGKAVGYSVLVYPDVGIGKAVGYTVWAEKLVKKANVMIMT